MKNNPKQKKHIDPDSIGIEEKCGCCGSGGNSTVGGGSAHCIHCPLSKSSPPKAQGITKVELIPVLPIGQGAEPEFYRFNTLAKKINEIIESLNSINECDKIKK